MKARQAQQPQDASWAESIQRYGREKLIDPEPNPDALRGRQYRDSRTCQKDKQREYDVLTHKWRDDQREEDEAQRELSYDLAAMEVAKERALRYESHYDVIKNSKKVDAPKTPPPKPKYQPEPEPRWRPREVTGQTGRSLYYWPNGDKEFHIINNRYIADHDRKSRDDKNEALDEAARRFGNTHHYNAIQGRLYDPDDESHYQEARRYAETCHGIAKQKSLPLIVKQREGACYNILAPHVIKDREHMWQREQREISKRQGDGLRERYEADLDRRMEELKVRNADRGIKRVSHQRHHDIVERGHNILTNQDFKGRTGKAYPPAYTQPPPHSVLRPDLPFNRNDRLPVR